MLLFFLGDVAFSLFSFVPNLAKDNLTVIALVGFIGFAVMIVYIIVGPKLFLGMQIFINSILDKKAISFGETYRQTRGKYWLLIGYSFFIALWFTPYIALIFLKIPYASVIGAIYVGFIVAYYYTIMPSIAIEAKTNHYITKNAELIKGNYLNILMLVLLTTTTYSVIYGLLASLFQGRATEMFILGIANAFISMFTYPFISIVSVIVYRKLLDNKKANYV
ncbi:MAG: hypothetical protein BWY15_02338 [Firmicutes bacterium ADurb.Bin193]|nr:MAG: hypothetical protein BWY15_02338 [Firmicutes bacterium ADurb.Bin193]